MSQQQASNPSPVRYRGACLCGAVQYDVSCEIVSASHCHCSMCRKFHGAAFATYGNVPRQHFRYVKGQDAVRDFESSPGVKRSFCANCGASLTWSDDRYANEIAFALGTLETPVSHLPGLRHIYVASKAPWYQITDTLPRFDEDS